MNRCPDFAVAVSEGGRCVGHGLYSGSTHRAGSLLPDLESHARGARGGKAPRAISHADIPALPAAPDARYSQRLRVKMRLLLSSLPGLPQRRLPRVPHTCGDEPPRTYSTGYHNCRKDPIAPAGVFLQNRHMGEPVTKSELIDLMRQYEAMFGENVPLSMLSADQDMTTEVLRKAIDSHDSTVIDKLIPPGAVS